MQNSLSLALLTLGGWLLLCLLLVLPLVISPYLHRRRTQRQVGAASAASIYRAGEVQGAAAEARFPAREEPLPALLPAWSLPDAVTAQQAAFQPAQQGAPIACPPGPGEEQRNRARPLARPFGVRISALSERGSTHADQENEDSFLTVTGTRSRAGQLHSFGLCVVADGVSGYATGHEASRQTLLAISQRFVPILTQSEVSGEDLGLLLAASIQSANRALFQHNERSTRPLGCTVTAAVITDQEITICHVGKNRAYFLPEQPPLRRLTVDHSIVESLVVAGLIRREEVYTHPKRNRIFRCLGQGPQVEIDTLHVPASFGDRLLFCSDGLWEALRDPTIEETLRRRADPLAANNQLVTLAKERGGQDDITSILVDLTGEVEQRKRPGISHIRSNRMNLDL